MAPSGDEFLGLQAASWCTARPGAAALQPWCGAYLMHKECLECEEAIADVCATHWICPNVGFKQQLLLFEDLHGDIDRWPSPHDPTWPKKVSSVLE